MKKTFSLTILFTVISLVYTFAQPAAQSNTLTPVLTTYYGIKDALIAGDANAASSHAGELLQALKNVDMKSLAPKDHTAFMAMQDKLAFDARHIQDVKKIEHQREHFASLSNNMYTLAKSAPMSAAPIYKDYCPMKKSSWLSPEEAIRNPYYGNTMLTCGKISETIKP